MENRQLTSVFNILLPKMDSRDFVCSQGIHDDAIMAPGAEVK